MYPRVSVTIDGVPLGTDGLKALISVTVTDKEGIQSDAVDMVFNDIGFAPPRRGAVADIQMGYGFAMVPVGRFVIDTVRRAKFPGQITVRGHSADLTAALKEEKARHFEKMTVRQIVEQIAGEHGLGTKISDAVSSQFYKWIGQEDESDLTFLERIAERNHALFTIKNGTLLWLKRGSGEAADGATIPPAIILPFSALKGRCEVSETDVDRYKTVKAYWQDHDGAKRQEVVVDADPEGEGELVLREAYQSQEEAEKAAEAKAREMIRGLIETTCAIVGRPALMAGQPINYRFMGPGFDEHDFIAEIVKHVFSKGGGLTTDFQAKLKSE
ncbi:MAG: contractile injection system protein, VgrG/Pvc8 family [Paracoccaceae bacterium]